MGTGTERETLTRTVVEMGTGTGTGTRTGSGRVEERQSSARNRTKTVDAIGENSSLPVEDMDCHSLVEFLQGSYALRYFVLVEGHGLLPSLLPFSLAHFVLLPSRDDDNLCSLWFKLQSLLPVTEVYEYTNLP